MHFPFEYSVTASMHAAERQSWQGLVGLVWLVTGEMRRPRSVRECVPRASSGVGLMGLQIAKLLGASVVVGTSTNAERRGRLLAFGVDVVLDSSKSGWVDRAIDATDGKGFEVIMRRIAA